MEMWMDMWRVDPRYCGVSELLIEPRAGMVGYIVAYPVDETPYIRNGCFDVDAFEDASIGFYFELTLDGYRTAHHSLRQECRDCGHVLVA